MIFLCIFSIKNNFNFVFDFTCSVQGVRARMVDKDFAPNVYLFCPRIFTFLNLVTHFFSLFGNYLKHFIPKFAVGPT